MIDPNETPAAKALRVLKSLQTRNPSAEEIKNLANDVQPPAKTVQIQSAIALDTAHADAWLAVCALAQSTESKDGNSNDRWQTAITKVQGWVSAGG